MRRGDVLLAVDGHAITTTAAHDLLAGVKQGQALRLRIRRDGAERDIVVTAGALRIIRPR